MAIQEYVTLVNHTDKPAVFTFDGQTQEVKPGGEYIADVPLTRWLFSNDSILALSAAGVPVYKLAITKGPNALAEELGPECFDTDPVTLKASREHPDLAASRQVRLQPVSVSRADFAPETVGTR